MNANLYVIYKSAIVYYIFLRKCDQAVETHRGKSEFLVVFVSNNKTSPHSVNNHRWAPNY